MNRLVTHTLACKSSAGGTLRTFFMVDPNADAVHMSNSFGDLGTKTRAEARVEWKNLIRSGYVHVASPLAQP